MASTSFRAIGMRPTSKLASGSLQMGNVGYLHYIMPGNLARHDQTARLSVAAQAALETLPRDAAGKLLETPDIRSDNGSCYISREFGAVLDERTEPQADQSALPGRERFDGAGNRTLNEALEGEDFADYLLAVKVIAKIIGGTMRSVCTVPWGFFPQQLTEAIPRRCTPCGDGSWPRPDTDGEKRTYNYGSLRCH